MAAPRALSLSFAAVRFPGGEAKEVKATLHGQRLSAKLGQLSVAHRTWQAIVFECPRWRIGRRSVACDEGRLADLPLAFDYRRDTASGHLRIEPGPGERIEGEFRQRTGAWSGSVRLDRVSIPRLESWWRGGPSVTRAGTVSGAVEVQTAAAMRISAVLELAEAAAKLDDETEAAGVSGSLRLTAAQKPAAWEVDFDVETRAGETYVDPVYLTLGGWQASGSVGVNDAAVEVPRLVVTAPGIGEVRASGRWRRGEHLPQDLDLETRGADLDWIYRSVIRPVWGEALPAGLEANGRTNLALRARDGKIRELKTDLREGALHDAAGRFELSGVEADIAWAADAIRPGRVSSRAGKIGGIPLGNFSAAMEFRPAGVHVDAFRVPLLDGALSVDGLDAEKTGEGWRWQSSAWLNPISMPALTAALKLPQVHGTVVGRIPRVVYENRLMRVDGALEFRVLDGVVTATDLLVERPLDRDRLIRADVRMNRLDLELLTRTYAFGTITGRVDAEVRGLELQGLAPARFQAQIRSSPGDYRRRISRKAVGDITRIGGASAGGALQQGLLSYFDDFGYREIGLSLRLENGVAHMDGIEPAPGGYVIVKGGGLPALNVIGYNRRVDWNALVSRLVDVMRGESKPQFEPPPR